MISGIFWMKWYWIALLFFILRLQDKLLGGCVLTKWQFGTYNRKWTEYYLIKKSKIPKTYWAIIIDWLFPILLIILAYLIQK